MSNRDKYSINAMSKLLKVPKSLVYYYLNKRKENNKISEEEIKLENKIIKISRKSRNNYGTRKIKQELQRKGIVASRRKISQIMKKYSLISNYTVAQYKVRKSKCNEDKIENVVDRDFDNREKLEIAVNVLTYVRVNNKWCYICTLIDLHNKEVIGYSDGENKDAELVYKAFLGCKYPLSEIEIFHIDRGNEFKIN